VVYGTIWGVEQYGVWNCVVQRNSVVCIDQCGVWNSVGCRTVWCSGTVWCTVCADESNSVVYGRMSECLQSVIQLCKRASGKLAPPDREKLWMPVMDALLAVQRKLRNNNADLFASGMYMHYAKQFVHVFFFGLYMLTTMVLASTILRQNCL
jgi:hypothetical protein